MFPGIVLTYLAAVRFLQPALIFLLIIDEAGDSFGEFVNHRFLLLKRVLRTILINAEIPKTPLSSKGMFWADE